MAGDCRRHRRFVTRSAGDDRGARHVVSVQLSDPAIGQILGRARILPAQPVRYFGGTARLGEPW